MSSLQSLGLGTGKGKVAAFMLYNQLRVKVDCLRSKGARYVKYGIPEMNVLVKEMELKGQLAAATRVSTGFKKLMCERNYENSGPLWDREK